MCSGRIPRSFGAQAPCWGSAGAQDDSSLPRWSLYLSVDPRESSAAYQHCRMREGGMALSYKIQLRPEKLYTSVYLGYKSRDRDQLR